MNRGRLDQVMSVADKVLMESGFECIETEWNQHDKILRVFVDRTGGVGLQDCVKANALLNGSPEFEASLPEQSILEISSPGIERPLRQQRHFERFIGSEVQVRLTTKVSDLKKASGRLVGVDQTRGEITIDTGDIDWKFPIGSVHKANLVYEWHH